MTLQSISFRHVEDEGKSCVLIIVNGARCATLDWKASREACKALDVQLRNVTQQSMSPVARAISATGISYRGVGFDFSQEQNRIVVISKKGKLLWDMRTDPSSDGGPSQARQIWSEWLRVTGMAEEWAKRESVADDAAILHRSGAPFGLANHPQIREEAGKRAEGDRHLRLAMRNGIRSAAVLPAPSVILDTRSPKEVLRGMLPGMSKIDRAALLAALKSKG